MGARRFRQDLRSHESGHGQCHRTRGRRRQSGHRRGCAGRATCPRVGAVGNHDSLGSRQDDLAHRRLDLEVCRRTCGAGVARQRQADGGRQSGRRPAGGGHLPVHGRLVYQDRGQIDSAVSSLHARRAIPRLHAARADWCRGANHPVELSVAHGGLEAGAGPGDRLHDRPEGRRGDSALGTTFG